MRVLPSVLDQLPQSNATIMHDEGLEVVRQVVHNKEVVLGES